MMTLWVRARRTWNFCAIPSAAKEDEEAETEMVAQCEVVLTMEDTAIPMAIRIHTKVRYFLTVKCLEPSAKASI